MTPAQLKAAAWQHRNADIDPAPADDLTLQKAAACNARRINGTTVFLAVGLLVWALAALFAGGR
jgi:hypothetical protein